MDALLKRRILVVDDLPDNLFLLKAILECEGYQVETADSGKVALSKVQSCPPDLLLLDVMMPEITGFEVTRYLRDQQLLLPILLITADCEVSLDQAIAAGANGLIHKPINFDELLAKVKVWCSQR